MYKTYVIESPNPLKCGNEPSWYLQLRSTGKVAVTTGTWRSNAETKFLTLVISLTGGKGTATRQVNKYWIVILIDVIDYFIFLKKHVIDVEIAFCV